ncbi:MAG TPA: PLP-dependent aminotransferase family protein [Ktedonobacterales bacterium]|nr:PLP-dependent aminotransferase family protein [Ktedonobacterales bacterium]
MPPPKLAPDLDLPLVLDQGARAPLQQQLREHLRQAILDGRLAPGTRLPSTRTLAEALGVSRTVTSAAYDDLLAEGYLEGRRGSGTYVGSDLPPLPRFRRSVPNVPPRWLAKAPLVAPDEAGEPPTIAFHLGMPSTASLPSRVWREAWRAVTSQLPPSGYGPPAGDPALRAALASYLGRSRGLACTPEDILITAGATHALDLIARATLSVGDAVGLEEPGYPAARHVLLARGGRPVPIPIDEDGLQVERLPLGSAAPLLVYTTPSHQYPLATRLSVARRLALLTWAQTNESLIVEDDYDSEFRFDTSPLPALASLDGAGCVAYIGTFSKVLTPALRVGYLVAPPLLRQRIEQINYLTDEYASWPLQQMLAAFISNGHLDRHIRRMRQQYAQKRQALARALAPIAPLAQLRGLEAGLHAYLELRSDLNARLVTELARQREVLVTPLDSYYVGQPDRAGVLLGYGSLDIPDILRGATILREVIEQVAARS